MGNSWWIFKWAPQMSGGIMKGQKKGYSSLPNERIYTFILFGKFFSDFLTKMSIYRKFMSPMALTQK